MLDKSIIEKIQKLFTLAGNNKDENEVSSALAKANEMLAKYNLTLSDVQAHEEKTLGKKTKAKRGEQNFRFGGYEWQRILWNSVAGMNFCYMFSGYKRTWMKWGKEDFRWHTHRFVFIVGQEHNVAACMAMGDYLHRAVEEFCIQWLGGSGKELKSNRAVSWKMGCVSRIHYRIADKIRKWEEEEALKNRSVGTALVVYKENENVANAEYVREDMGLKIEFKKPTKKKIDTDAYLQGMAKGDEMGLDRPLQKGV